MARVNEAVRGQETESLPGQSASHRERTRHRHALAVLAFLLLLRLGLAWPAYLNPRLPVRADAFGYLSLATSLATGHGYTGGPGTTLDLYRPPGYPLFLALVLKTSGWHLWVVVLVQQCLIGLMAFLLYGLGRIMGHSRVGLAAATVYALTPNSALWGEFLFSEILFSFLVLMAAICLFRHLLTPSKAYALAAGILLGFGALVRPIGQVLLPLWALLALIGPGKVRFTRSGVAGGVILAVGFLVTTLPWAARNQRVWGTFSISPISQWNLGYYLAASTLADADNISIDEAREQVPLSEVPRAEETAAHLEIIVRHPVSFTRVYAVGTLATLFGYGRENLRDLLGEPLDVGPMIALLRSGDLPGAAAWFLQSLSRHDQWRGFVVAFLMTGFIISVFSLSVRGAVTLWSEGGPARALMILVVVTLIGLVLPVGSVGSARFRLPMEPFLALLAGAAIRSPRTDSSAARQSEVGNVVDNCVSAHHGG